MSCDPSRVVLEDGLWSNCAVHVKRAHHRDFPEIQAECGSLVEAAAHLVGQLTTDREGAHSGWQREAIDLAIADVKRFLEALGEATRDREASCRCGARASGRREPSVWASRAE